MNRTHRIDRVIVSAAIALVLGALVVAGTAPAAFLQIDWRLGIMVLALAGTVPLHLRLPSGLDASPVAPSIGLAIVLTPFPMAASPLADTAVLVLALSAGTMLGLVLARMLGQRPTSKALIASRLISSAVAAVLYRNLPLVGGQSLSERAADWAGEPWRIAMAMALCGLAATAVDLGLLVLRTAPTGRLRAQGGAHVREVGPIWLAVLGIAVAIALGFGPLGLWSVPVMASPLVLMRTVLRRQAAIARVRHDTVVALGRLTEESGYTTRGHGRRVVELARGVGLQLMLTDRELRDLEMAALMHDVGQLGLTDPIPQGATSEASPTDQFAISADGAQIARSLSDMERVATIIERQPTPFRNVREFGEDLPLECRILKACNAYDDLTQGRPEARAAAVERMSLGMGYEYDPDVVDLLANLPQEPTGQSR